MNPSNKFFITCPSDAVDLVPYLIGFRPQNSLVVLGMSAQGNFVLRFDLVGPEHFRTLLAQLYGLLINNKADAVILLGYGPEESAVPLLAEVQDALEEILTVKEVLRVDEGRWWSLICTDPKCCPPEGTPYDPTTSRLAAQATFSGLVAYSSREEKAAMIAPVEGEDKMWMAAETERAEHELLGDGPLSPRLVEGGLSLVRSLIGQDRRLTDREVARLGVVLTHLRVRDEAWARIVSLDPRQQLTLWQDMTRRAAGEYVAAPAALLAFIAYLTGDGALALIALERCFEAVPGYQAAILIRDCLHRGIPPHVLQQKFQHIPEMLAKVWGEDQNL